MSMSEIISQPRMFLHQLEGRITFKELQGFANRHCWRQFNKQMDMINSNMQLVNFTSMFNCSLADESFTINFNPIKFEGIPSVLAFPYEMESILPEGMFKTLQIHFFAPDSAENFTAHAKSINLVTGTQSQSSSYINKHQELNLVEEGNSSLGLKAEVSLPLM